MNDKNLIRDMLDKMNGDLNEDWQSIADRFGVGIHADTLRKAGLGIKMADQAGCLCFDNKPENESVQVAIEELYKERCKLRDERTALNKRLRDEARLENKIDRMEDLIAKYANEKYESSLPEEKRTFSDDRGGNLLAIVSDIHYGLKIDDGFTEYNPVIAAKYMGNYADRIIEEGKRRGSNDLTIVLLGDLISGAIHKTVQLQNTDNVLDQMIGCSEMMAEFVYRLSLHFQRVSVYGVGGNHSRIDKKEDAMNDERLDNIILWYLQTAMRPRGNVDVFTHKETESKDPTVCEFLIGKYTSCVAVHGDYDDYSPAGLQKLISYIGYTPNIVIYGHKHEFACMSVTDTMMIRNGCLCGTGDNYTAKNRMRCKPCQTIVVMNSAGRFKEVIPVWF